MCLHLALLWEHKKKCVLTAALTSNWRFLWTPRAQVNLKEFVASDSVTNSNIASVSCGFFGFSSPPSRCHACFLKVQNHLSISHSGLGCSFSISVNEGGIKQVSNYCPDPGEPENGKRIGSDFRWVSPQQPAYYEPDLCWWELELSERALFQTSKPEQSIVLALKCNNRLDG